MKKSYIHILVFTLLLICVGALIGFGFNYLNNTTPAWQLETNAHAEATAPPATDEETAEDETPTDVQEPLLRDEPGHQPTVVLDAGHGFGDVGCAGPETSLGVYEYEYTLDMINTLKEELEQAGIRVLLTHDGSDYPTNDEIIALCEQYGVEYDTSKETWKDNAIFSPYERVIYMNALDAMYGVDFAFSVHINSNPDSAELNGFDLDFCAENSWSEDSRVYAEALKDMLTEEYEGRNLWYYEDSWDDAFVVTKYNSMPSVLLETGYYTNPGDCVLLKDKEWRDELMKNTAKTIIEVINNEYEER